MNPTHAPLRLITGAFILNSGISKLGADEETAAGLHGMASTAYPFVADMKPKDFAELLAYGEIALGSALLAPMVPSAVAGAGLAGFGAGLVGLYLRLPGMRQEGSIRPTPDGIGIAKDSWLVGAGLTLAAQGVLGGARHAAKSAGRGAKDLAGSARDSARSAVPFTS